MPRSPTLPQRLDCPLPCSPSPFPLPTTPFLSEPLNCTFLFHLLIHKFLSPSSIPPPLICFFLPNLHRQYLSSNGNAFILFFYPMCIKPFRLVFPLFPPLPCSHRRFFSGDEVDALRFPCLPPFSWSPQFLESTTFFLLCSPCLFASFS